MPVIQINNKGVHILEMNKGASQSVVMIHGMFTNLSIFYFNIAHELAKDYHVVLYDLRSHGLSEKSDRGYDLATMSADLIALMDTLDLPNGNLVGYSFGGLIALYTAMHYSHRVDKLAVIEAPNPNHKNTHELLERYGGEFLEYYMQNYAKTTGLNPGKRQFEKNQRLYDFLFKDSSLIQDMIADKDFFATGAMRSISQHTLLLYGNKSDCHDAALFLKDEILSAELCMGDGDHNIPVQNPEWVSKTLHNFIKKNYV